MLQVQKQGSGYFGSAACALMLGVPPLSICHVRCCTAPIHKLQARCIVQACASSCAARPGGPLGPTSSHVVSIQKIASGQPTCSCSALLLSAGYGGQCASLVRARKWVAPATKAYRLQPAAHHLRPQRPAGSCGEWVLIRAGSCMAEGHSVQAACVAPLRQLLQPQAPTFGWAGKTCFLFCPLPKLVQQVKFGPEEAHLWCCAGVLSAGQCNESGWRPVLNVLLAADAINLLPHPPQGLEALAALCSDVHRSQRHRACDSGGWPECHGLGQGWASQQTFSEVPYR